MSKIRVQSVFHLWLKIQTPIASIYLAAGDSVPLLDFGKFTGNARPQRLRQVATDSILAQNPSKTAIH
jgi:nucleoid DNA-binding protein